MYYVSKKVGERSYAVMDTSDGVEETHDVRNLLEYVNKGITIVGVVVSNKGTGVRVCSPVVRLLCHLDKGSPVRVRIVENSYDTAVYLGMRKGNFEFYDGGFAPYQFSPDFIDTHHIDVKTDGIDPVKLRMILDAAARQKGQ